MRISSSSASRERSCSRFCGCCPATTSSSGCGTAPTRSGPTSTVQLKRRHDLVANLVELVKGYASHERTTFDEVTEARSDAAAASTPEDKTRAENVLSGALGRLLVTAEAYPDLKAEDRFQDLHQELVRLEDTIAMARQAYNLTVQAYNNGVQTMPGAIVAWLMSFEPRDYLSAPASETAVPTVQLSTA